MYRQIDIQQMDNQIDRQPNGQCLPLLTRVRQIKTFQIEMPKLDGHRSLNTAAAATTTNTIFINNSNSKDTTTQIKKTTIFNVCISFLSHVNEQHINSPKFQFQFMSSQMLVVFYKKKVLKSLPRYILKLNNHNKTGRKIVDSFQVHYC